MEYYSAMKKNEIMPFAATRVQLEIIILSEWSQRMTDILCYHLDVMWNLENWYKWTYLQNRNRLTNRKQTYGYRSRKWDGEGGINQEFGINRYTVPYIKWINNKDLLYNTGDYIQYLIITYNGKEFGEEYIYVYVCIHVHTLNITESLCYIPEAHTLTML